MGHCWYINNLCWNIAHVLLLGQEDYDGLRPLSYPDTDVAVICLPINRRNAFENVSYKVRIVENYLS